MNCKFAYCAFPDEKTAAEICRRLVEDRIIACANLFPVKSIFIWKGQTQGEIEVVAVMKTVEAKTATLKERIRAEHPYETPGLVLLPIDDGLPNFLRWVAEQSGVATS